MNIEDYLDNLIEVGLEKNHWFMTKQTMSDFYFPFYVGHIVETYATKHMPNQNYQMYYTQCFKDNPETRELYPKQCESENTYRNSIIAEFVGLIERTDSQYAHANVTNAYLRLKSYLTKAADVSEHKDIVDRQIEKLCLNVIDSRKMSDVREVTIFPIIFIYKILLGLYSKYGDSKLTYEEFSLFVMRAKNYQEYDQVMNLIEQYRKHNYNNSYDLKIRKILKHQSTTNVRFDTMIGSLTHIDYKKNEYYRISNSQDSYEYMQKIVEIYENSDIAKITDKNKLKTFMQSQYYFTGEIDKVDLGKSISAEEFKQMIENEDKFLKELERLAEKYGEQGTTTIQSEVRLSSVQQAFRDKLIEQYGQKCLLCGVTHKDMLVASHIKDAAKSNIFEKADFNNGLLLCANHDKLFDKFLITFNFYDGKIQISKTLSDEEKNICQLDENYCLPEEMLTPERSEYLMWHNEEYHKKESER